MLAEDDRIRALPVAKAKRAISVALYLAGRIKAARELTENDPNKKVKFHTNFTKDTSDKLKDLRDYWGYRNQEQALVHAIHELHARYLSRL